MNIIKPPSKQPIPSDAKLAFKGVLFDVYQWEQEVYDGTTKTFEKIKRKDAVSIIAVTEEGKIIMAKQRQPGREPYVSTVGGGIDEGEDPLASAQRELLEESGYVAKNWKLVYAVQPSSKMEWTIYLMVAQGCRKVSEQKLDGAEEINLIYLEFDQYIEAVLQDDFAEREHKIKVLEVLLDSKKLAEYKNFIFN